MNSNNMFIHIPDVSQIKQFDAQFISPRSVIMVLGKRGTGKTTMVNHLISELYERYDDFYVFSKTASLNFPYPFPWCPEKNRIDGLNISKLLEIYNKQKEDIKKYQNIDDKRVKHICVLLDDVISDDIIAKRGSNTLLVELACNSRHAKMDLYLTSQVLQSGFSPQIRKNIDYFFAFRINDGSTMEGFCKLYLSRFKKLGPIIVDNITNFDNYYTIVADNKESSKMKSITDYIYKYRAELKKEYKFNKKEDSKPQNEDINLWQNLILDSDYDNLGDDDYI
ncbi:MAG: hypothetical protein KFKLKKLM_02643 [Flavobacteriales bacterium]|nr:hypothetical protein [Flavobacteriales bacterium]